MQTDIPIWFAVGCSVGAIVGWLLKQRLTVAQIAKIENERDNFKRQLQESVNQSETYWNEAAEDCSVEFSGLTAATDTEVVSELRTARDQVCRCFATHVIPRYCQFVQRRLLYFKNDDRHCLEIVSAATQELTEWDYILTVLNDEWLLNQTGQAPCRIGHHDLADLRHAIDEVASETGAHDLFMQAVRALVSPNDGE